MRIDRNARPSKLNASSRIRLSGKAPRKPRKPFPWGIVVAILLVGIFGLACCLRMTGA